MMIRACLPLWLAACATSSLVPPGTALHRLDRRGLFHECIAQLAQRGIPVAPPPELFASEKQIGLGAYQPLPKRVVMPPVRKPGDAAGERLLGTIAEVMTGGRWQWRALVPDRRTANLLYRLHMFGLLYQGLIQYLQHEGLLRPGRIDDESRYDAERISSRARVAFLRYYVERVDARLKPLYDLYERVVRSAALHFDPKLREIASQPPDQARRYWKEQGRWMIDARSGQRQRGAFFAVWMVEDFDTVDATAHVRELAELRPRK
jgi:hypothetical protein